MITYKLGAHGGLTLKKAETGELCKVQLKDVIRDRKCDSS